jgi:hypothetical protein
MSLQSRCIQIAGSAKEDVDRAVLAKSHNAVRALTSGILKAGGALIVGVGEDIRLEENDPNSSRLFDWTVLDEVKTYMKTLESLGQKPKAALVRVITSQKNIDKIPSNRQVDWEYLLTSGAVEAQPLDVNWSAAAYIRQRQAEAGHGLIILGGGEGVEHSASLYVERGRVVIPLDLELGAFYNDGTGGAPRLYKHALAKPERFVRGSTQSYRTKLQLSSLTKAQDVEGAARRLVEILAEYAVPDVFGIRLLNPTIAEFNAVENFFINTLRHCVETELKFRLVDMGQAQATEAFINVDIFERLHYSEVVIADLTAYRPNNFFEAGYALGHATPVIFTALKGTTPPFDVQAAPIHFWEQNEPEGDRRRKFMEHWLRYIHRPGLVRRRELG